MYLKLLSVLLLHVKEYIVDFKGNSQNAENILFGGRILKMVLDRGIARD